MMLLEGSFVSGGEGCGEFFSAVVVVVSEGLTGEVETTGSEEEVRLAINSI